MLKAVGQGHNTRAALIEAAFAVLREVGFAGASARAIGDRAGINQALVFYHFGGVNQLLIAALDRSSQARMTRYEAALAGVTDAARLLAVAWELHREDVETGHTTVLAEMAAAALSNELIRDAMAARVGAWLAFTTAVIERVLTPTPVGGLIPASAIAHGILAMHLGADLLARIEPDSEWIEAGFTGLGGVAGLLGSHG